MTLAYDTCRCKGLLPALNGLTEKCSKRDTCQRYTERENGGPRTVIADWLCPGLNEYFEHYIETKNEH